MTVIPAIAHDGMARKQEYVLRLTDDVQARIDGGVLVVSPNQDAAKERDRVERGK